MRVKACEILYEWTKVPPLCVYILTNTVYSIASLRLYSSTRYRLLYNTETHSAVTQTSDYTVYTPTGRDRTRAAHAARVVWPSGLDARANVPGHSSRTRLTRLVSLVGPLPHPCTWLTYSRFTKFMLDCSCRAHLFFCCTQRTRSKCDGWRAWDHLVRNEPSSQSVGAA